MKTILLACLLVLQASIGAAQVGKLYPRDEADKNPELFAFRAQLQAAVARRDTAAVLEVLDPHVKLDFGGSSGIADFKSQWKPDSPESKLWEELGTVLALGGLFLDPDTFAAPYVFKGLPDQFDAFEHLVVLGSSVRVRAEPRLGSQVLASLTFDIVRVAQAPQSMTEEQGRDWKAVKLKDGRVGYVSNRYVRSAVDYRAIFSRKNGRWRLATFIAGD